MAFGKKVTLWSLVGSLWTAFCLSAAIYVTIPDAPWNYPFWMGLMLDPTAYYHEIFVILGTYLAGMAVILGIRFWWALASFLESFRTMEALPDGQLVFVRRKKK